MSASQSDSSVSSGQKRHWYQRIGPGLITACVVIGPGSILTSSKIGAANGFSLMWVVVVAVVFMLIFMEFGARLGVMSNESVGTLIAQRAGRWLAVLIGLAVFFISAAFQFGNNLGVHSAFKAVLEDSLGQEAFQQNPMFDYLVVAFNAIAIGFLFVFRNLYRALERLMMCFVGLMLVSFALNLGFAFMEMSSAEPPPAVSEEEVKEEPLLDITLLGLVGTTFVITAAFYQAYLVQQKGWSKAQLADGRLDARVGSILMALITLMLMSTAAAALRGEELKSVEDVAAGLAPLFGDWGLPLFCIGLFAAAYSSFLVNSMIGGFILADGLGLGNKPTDLWPRILTTVVLLTGMGVALFVIKTGIKPVPAIVAAQAVTVLAAPLIGGALLWLTNRPDIMGEQRNGPLANICGSVGIVLLLGMAWFIATDKIPKGYQEWQESKQKQEKTVEFFDIRTESVAAFDLQRPGR